MHQGIFSNNYRSTVRASASVELWMHEGDCQAGEKSKALVSSHVTLAFQVFN